MPGEQGLARVSTHSPSEILTVSALARSVRDLLERRYPLLWVAGELSNFTVAKSGHACFVLKAAHAQVRCVMFRQRQENLEWTPPDGMQVEVQALVSLYEPRGDFQLAVETWPRAGPGRHRYRARNRLHDRRLRRRPARAYADRRCRAGQSRARGAARGHFQADGKPRPAPPPATRKTHAARRSPCAQAGSPRSEAAGPERAARPIAVQTRASCRPNLVRAPLGSR